jgi:hypothetical protein
MHNLFRKYRQILLITAVFGILFATTDVSGQNRSRLFEDYIAKWSDLAVEHMHRYGIPASIKLAQGILESAAGTSYLARNANNHFGIKCHDWTGPRVFRADDTPNCCFRKYATAEESWNDHSIFLTTRAHYRFLFDLPITDFRGWARGLQRAGYATNPQYANKLINIIERYQLYRFDRMQPGGSVSARRSRTVAQRNNNVAATVQPRQRNINNANNNAAQQTATWTHQPYITHGLLHIIARDGDTYASIARAFGFRERDLIRFNDATWDCRLRYGDIVYFEPKRRRAEAPHNQHIVRAGESMHSISQKYGIRLRNLYRLNRMRFSDVPKEGDMLILR